MAQMTITQFMTGIKNWVLGKIGNITALIPSQASSSNQLADKAFVNSSIATATATFRGTYNVVSDLSLSYNATHAQIQTALATKMSALSITPDNNDYVFVQIPTADATPTQIAKIERYKYSGSAWAFEYELNNSGFTAAQWAAINSGITGTKVTKLDDLPTNAELTTLLAGKQNVLTFDNVPTQNSDNPVKSGGIYSAIATAITNATNAIKEWANGIFAKIDGYYETMVVGTAKNLEGQNVTEGTFFARPTGGASAGIANGLAQLQGVKGNSVKYNQLYKWTSKSAGADITYDTKTYVMTITTNGSSPYSEMTSDEDTSIINGRKYFMLLNVISDENNILNSVVAQVTGNGNLGVKISNINGVGIYKAINTSSNTGRLRMLYQLKNYTTEGRTVQFQVSIFDLTAIGIDNLTTVAEVEAWLAANWGARGYYPYSDGVVLNVNMTGIESFKKNLLNPTTGKAEIIGAYSEVYGNYYGICGTYGTITFTDVYGNESTITPDADGKSELSVAGELTVADAGADCAVFLWWDGTETEYSEYGTSIAKLDISHIYGKLNGSGELVRVWPTGACGIGDVQDYLKIEDGEIVAKKEFKIITYDGSQPNWSLQSINSYNIANFYRFPSGMKERARVISDKYRKQSSLISNTQDEGIYVANEYFYFRIKSSNASTPTQLNTYLSSNPFTVYYQLDTPETYTDLVYMGSELFEDGTPVTLPVNYKADNWGIERILPLNTPSAMVTTAPTIECKYSLDAVEQLDTHTAEIADLYDKNLLMDAKKANKVGEYPDMVVGSAAALKGDTAQSAEFVFRPTGSPDKVASGVAQIEAIKGKSLVWNQIVPSAYKDYKNTSTQDTKTEFAPQIVWYNNTTLITSTNLNGSVGIQKCIITPHDNSNTFRLKHNGATSDIVLISSGVIKVVTNHKYLFVYNTKSNNPSISDGLVVDDIMLFDLTQMFGAGNEPATVAEFEKMYPLAYYAYNAGTIINNKATGIEVVGFNQWDEEWENKYYPYGVARSISSSIGSKNLVPVISGETYFLNSPTISGAQIFICYYDAKGNYIADSPDYTDSGRVVRYPLSTLTIPSGVAFIRFSYYKDGTAISYNHDICINLSDPSKNGTYEPYKKSTVELNIPTLTGKLNGEGESVVICADGMRGVGTAFDEGVVENGYLTKVVKRFGVVDLGSLSGWVLRSGTTDVFQILGVTGLPYNTDSNNNSVCSAYTTAKVGSGGTAVVGGNKQLSLYYNPATPNERNIYIKDSAITSSDIVSGKISKLNGVMVVYELAEPEVYVLDTPIPVNYQVDGGGTERRLPEDTASEVNAPFAANIRYSMDAVGTLNNLPKSFDSTGGLDDLCSALATTLGGALNGTLSIQRGAYNATTQKYAWTVTFTPNA